MADEQLDETLVALYGKLQGQVKKRQSKRVIKTCDEILKIRPDDFDAVACKVATLIDLRKTEEAKSLITSKADYIDRFAFELAYCLYRNGQIQESLAQLSKVKEERALDRKRLEGQLRYRLEEYDACIQLYREIFSPPYDEDSMEAKANLVAAYVASGRAADVPAALADIGCSAHDGLELAFNVACGLLSVGSMNEAKEQLISARRIGEETLFEEGLDDDEVTEELAGVDAQLAYIDAIEQRPVDAMEAYKAALDLEGPDDLSNAVAAANLVLCQVRIRSHDRKGAQEKIKDLEPFLERSSGLLKVRASLENRLGASTCQGILAAYAAGSLAANKIDHAKEAVRSLETVYPGAPVGSLMNAAILARDGKTREAMTALHSREDQYVGSDIHLSSTALLAQLMAHSQEYTKAAELLQNLPIRYAHAPAVLATCCTLYELQGDSENAKKTASFALQRSEIAAKTWALKKLANIEISAGNLSGAAGYLLDLVKMDATAWEDPSILCVLPRCIACCDPSKHLDMGGVPTAFSDDVDVDALESQAGNMLLKKRQVNEEDMDGGHPSTAEKKEKKKKRKRKIRYPKDFNPDNPGPLPDPERWLPKWQRAENRKLRKKKKDKDATRGSQGAGKVDMSLDRTAPSVSTSTIKATSASAQSNKKKKKKGKGKK